MATRAAIAAADRAQREADSKRRDRRSREANEVARYHAEKDAAESVSRQFANYGKGVKDAVGAAGSIYKMSGNHPQWYKNLPGADLVAKVPTFYRAGTRLAPGWLANIDECDIVPGICVIWYQSSLPNYYPSNIAGNVGWKNSPLNMSLTRFMANLRKRNSRVGEYDPSDIGLYFYAVAEYIYDICKIGLGIRIYNTYYADNAYFAKALLRANGFDPLDFIANVAGYKMMYQRHVNLFNASIVVPKDITFLQRRAWMASALVKDHQGDKAQVYCFRRYSVGALNEYEDTVIYTADTSLNTYSTYVTGLDSRVRNLINSTGIVTMIADLRAAYQPSDLLNFPSMDGTEKVEFSESEHDLEQIHNIQTAPFKANSVMGTILTKMSIGADGNTGYLFQGTISGGVVTPMCVLYGPSGAAQSYTGKASTNYDQNFLNFYDEKMGDQIDCVLEATRLRVVTFDDHHPTGNNHFVVKTCGTEIPLCFQLVTLSPVADQYYDRYFGTDIEVGSFSANELICLEKSSHFDWFPIIWVQDGVLLDNYITFGEIDHPVALSNVNLDKLHEFCSYSEFYCSD